MNILDYNKEKLNKIAKEQKLKFVILHGSRVTGKTVNPEPDIDIAFLGQGKLSAKNYLNLYSNLAEVFGNNLDLKQVNTANPLFRFEVIKNGQLLYGNKEEYNEYQIYAYRSYIDTKPLYKNMAQSNLNRINRLLKK